MRSRAPDLAISGAITLVVLGPLLLGGGSWLVGDMVFVPRQPWKPAWLGLDGSLPRAVPMDALVSLATYVVPGAVVQKLLLAGGLLAGGLGVARVVREQPWYARAAAITLFCWNPWVYERLLIGQWAILLGYLLLPWVAVAATRLRRDPDAWGPAAVVLVLSAWCSPSSGVMAVLVLVVLGLSRDRRTWWRVPLLAVLANLTWLVPAVTADAARISTDGVFEAFAARAESGAGVVASLVSLGGIWKTSILPGERESALLVSIACALSAAALVALWRSGRARGRWLGLGAVALALALLPALAPGAVEGVGDRVPYVALLRDSHRFLAPLGLVLAVGAAHAASQVGARVTVATRALWSVVGLLVVAPLLLLPSLAWGAAGELQRSSYPDAWTEAAAMIDDDEVTVVLPWSGSYRSFPWNHGRAVLDPAPRLLPGVVLVDDRVLVEDLTVAPEDPRVLAVDRALAAADPVVALRGLGVRWVLVERRPVGLVPPDAAVVLEADGLVLVDLSRTGEVAEPPTVLQPATDRRRQVLVTIGHTSAVLLILSGAAWILRTRE